jgi:hypothetical protein
MVDNLIIEQVRRSIEARRARPPEERWEELVRRGAIDSEGRVILGTETAPEAKPKPGWHPRTKRKASR